MATQFDPTRYYFGSGPGVGRFNQPYYPTVQDVVTRMNRPEITGMPGQGVYIDQMSNPQYISRVGPDIFFRKRRDPLGANLYPNVTDLGFNPSSGLMGPTEEEIIAAGRDRAIAASGERIPTPAKLGFAPGGSSEPTAQNVDVVDMVAEDNPYYQDQALTQQRSGGLLGDMFGNASALDEYFTPEQKSQLQNQAIMSAAMQLLASSGPSRTPVGLGQALGEAYGAGQKGYTAAQQNLLQSMAMKQKMEEYKRARDIEARITGALVGEGAAPTPGATITPEQAISAPGGQAGPTVARAAMIGTKAPAAEPMSEAQLQHDRYMNASAIAAKAGDTTKAQAYAALAKQILPQQESFKTVTGEAATNLGLDPKGIYQVDTRTNKITTLQAPGDHYLTVTGEAAKAWNLDPSGVYSINTKTNQVSTTSAPSDQFKIVTGKTAEALGLSGRGKWQVNSKTGQATLVANPEGVFGGGVTGGAYDILLNAGVDTPEYALAYREANKPVLQDVVQPDGSVKQVYVTPAPLPSSFPAPTFKGRAASKSVISQAVQPATVVSEAPAVAAVPSGALIPTGTKSTPYAPTAEQIGKAKTQIGAAMKLYSAVDELEKDIDKNGLQTFGLGEAGGRQGALFQDTLLQLKELQNLGVLNGPDERILLQELADPTSVITSLKGGKKYMMSKIKVLKEKAVRESNLINSQFPKPIVNLPESFQAQVSGSNALQNAIDAELARRAKK